MLSLLALAMLTCFMTLIMSGKAAPVVALVLTPIAFAVAGGFGGDLGPMMLKGVQQLAPTGVMLCFAILYFSIMSDVGLFDPLIRSIVRMVDQDPVRIVTGTAVLALLVSLDGDGATTYIICTSALLPLYRRLGLNPLILACLLTLSCSITNITPWGGPTARVASALSVGPSDVFVPLIPSMLAGAAFVIALSYMLGRRERARLALPGGAGRMPEPASQTPLPQNPVTTTPVRSRGLLWFNAALTLALMVILVLGVVPLPVLFIVACVIALAVNYPSLKAQTERIVTHAPNVLRVIVTIFGSGVFVGILDGTGMASALATSVVNVLPSQLGPWLAPVTSLLSIPFSFFMTNTGYFFGVAPVISEAAAHFGTTPAEVARAALLDGGVHFLAPVTASTHLLVALVGVEFAQHQRYALPWTFALWIVMLAGAVLTGAVPLQL